MDNPQAIEIKTENDINETIVNEIYEDYCITFPNSTQEERPQCKEAPSDQKQNQTQTRNASNKTTAVRMEASSSKRKRRVVWDEASEMAILKLWAEKIGDLRGVRKNSHVYAEMEQQMFSNSFNVSAYEIKIKIRNMQRLYSSEKKRIIRSGGDGPYEWKWYEEVNKILGSFKNQNNLDSVMDESATFEPQSPQSANHSDCSDGDSEPQTPGHSNSAEAKKTSKLCIQEEMLKEMQHSNRMAKEEMEFHKLFMEKAVATLERMQNENEDFHKKLLDVFMQNTK